MGFVYSLNDTYMNMIGLGVILNLFSNCVDLRLEVAISRINLRKFLS